MRYPSKERIMKAPMVQFSHKDVIRPLRAWRTFYWRGAEKELDQYAALEKLVDLLNSLFEQDARIRFERNANTCMFVYKTNTIFLNGSLSILSTLHEFGHALEGRSELKACRWSIHLFKQCWPKTFERLTWKGHMLVDNKQSICRTKSSSKSQSRTST